MLTLCCDDSGTHAESEIAVAACFISDDTQWEHFDGDWKAANADEHFGVFHMADFVARKEQFALSEWQDGQKRDRTIKRLITITNIRKKHGFFAAVEKSAYDAEVPKELRERYKIGNNHYTFAVRMCMGKIIKWRRRHNHDGPVQFVFDRMTKGSGEINAVFEFAIKEGEEKTLRENGIRRNGCFFKNKTKFYRSSRGYSRLGDLALHAEGIFATEEAVRKSYGELIRWEWTPDITTKSLKTLVEEVKSEVKNRKLRRSSVETFRHGGKPQNRDIVPGAPCAVCACGVLFNSRLSITCNVRRIYLDR
jgi:hypothetical protein